MSGTAIETVVLSFTVITPISSFSYLECSYVLKRNNPFSISPIISGDNPLFTITSGTLPPGLSINQLESFLVFLHLHSHLHLSLFRLPINSDSFKLNYPLLSMLYPLSLSFSSLLLFLSFSFSLFLLSFERSLIYICIGTIGLGSFQSHIKPTQIILLKPTNHLFQLIILLTCYPISQFMIIQFLLIHRNTSQICISNHLFSCICL